MSIESSALVDGTAADHVPAADRGLHYGDGLFETIACRDGEPRWIERHWERLAAGCDRLHIAVPDRVAVETEVRRLAAGLARCMVKLIYTRGTATARGYRPTGQERPTRILSRHPWVDLPPGPFHVCTSRVRLSGNISLAGIKHLNRLDSVLAQQQLAGTHCTEAIMLSPSGLVTCGSMSNVFVIEEGGLLTPELIDCGVAGVMRGCVLRACGSLGIRVRVGSLSPQSLAAAAAVMITNVRLGLQSVHTLDGRALRCDGRVELLQRWIDTHD